MSDTNDTGWRLSRECIRDTLLAKRSGSKNGLVGFTVDTLRRTQLAPHVEERMIAGRYLRMMEKKQRKNRKEAGSFVYLGFHFIPVRKFNQRDGGVGKVLDNCMSDGNLGMSVYNWGKLPYSRDDFLAASGNPLCDIYRCVETGKEYIPAKNELFMYKRKGSRCSSLT